MKKNSFYLICLISSLFLASSFIGYDTIGKTPGTLQFVGNAGGDNLFTFQKWGFTSLEIPADDFTKIKASIEINASSFTCDWKDLEKGIKKKKDYFYIKKFPTVWVNIDGAELQEDGHYTTEAALTLKGVTDKVTLTFSVSDTKPYQVKGGGTIIRQDFKFNGDGPKDEVPVRFDFVLPME